MPKERKLKSHSHWSAFKNPACRLSIPLKAALSWLISLPGLPTAFAYLLTVVFFAGTDVPATTRLGYQAQSVAYLALRFGSGPTVSSWVGTHTTLTSTGDDSKTGPSFKPQAVLMFGSIMEAIDTGYTDNLAPI